MSGVQRFLSGHKNHVRTAAFISGNVKPIAGAVVQKPVARLGSASAAITGTFVGSEQQEYELEILDTIATTPLITAPVFSGVGNGDMTNLDSIGLGAREILVELADLGEILTAASTELAGTTVTVRTPGDAGNNYTLRVNRGNLVHTPQAFSLLAELEDGTSSVTGPEFDWDTKTMTGDALVPVTAHRISFGDDFNNIYVQYKKQVEGEYAYIFEPPLRTTVPAKTVVNFVTGTYTVQLWEDVGGVPTLRETYANIITLYDLLEAIKTTSTRLLVQGAVAYDRATGGQALLEMPLNTDARVVINSGEGSEFATGFIDVSVSAGAPTELIEALCIAATPSDTLGAGLGQEMWEVKGSVSGIITRSIKSGETVVGDFFEAKIPQKIPDGYTVLPRGSFTVHSNTWNDAKRVYDPDTDTFSPIHPDICFDSMTLGINASEQLITLTYRRRKADDECSCIADTAVALNPECLGLVTTSGGGNMAYSATTITRLIALYDWFADTVRENSDYFNDGPRVEQDPFISQPTNNPAYLLKTNFAYVSLFKMIEEFEGILALIDKLVAGAYKTAGETAWDTAVTEFKADVDTHLSGPGASSLVVSETFDAYEALLDGDAVSIIETDLAAFKIRKARAGDLRYGFVKAASAAGAPATIFYFGENDAISSTESWAAADPQSTWKWMPSVTNPGKWVRTGPTTTPGDPPVLFGVFDMNYISATNGYKQFSATSTADTFGYALLADRYSSRLKWVLITAGISPRGKSDPNSGGGDGCWVDVGGDFWWEVTGENGLTYAPAFTGVPYYSAVKKPGSVGDNGLNTSSAGYFSTKEFGFIMDIPCKESLVPGDIVVLKIGNAGVIPTYEKGDKLLLGIVAAQDIAFFGGKDGDNVQTWHITDSVDGPRGPYLLDTDTPAPFNDGSVGFLITQGTIDYAKGDRFTFSIEGGHFRWRRVGGAWSGSLTILDTPIALDLGLSVLFTLGASPGFTAGDSYAFTALQPYALSNLVKPDFDKWVWGLADPASTVIDLGASKLIEAIGIAYHTLPSTAVITVDGGAALGVYTWTENIPWAKNVIGKLLTVSQNARYLRVTITNTDDGNGIGWLYIGEAVKFENSAQVNINQEYRVNRSSGQNPSALFKGKGVGSSIQWTEGHLTEADYAPMLEMLDWLKGQNDEALMFFPQETRQTEVVIGTVESDDITFNDVYNFQPNVAYERRLSATIPLKGVVFKS